MDWIYDSSLEAILNHTTWIFRSVLESLFLWFGKMVGAAKLKRQNDTIFVNWRLDRNRNQFQRQLANWWTAASVCKDWRPDLVWFSWEASKMKTISVAIGELVNRGLRLERLEAEASKMNQFYRQFPQDDWICHL